MALYRSGTCQLGSILGPAVVLLLCASAPIYTNPPGLNGLYEMRRWTAAGVSTRQLFQALTLDNARILHRDRNIGSIEKGKIAHLLLLRANPLDKVEAYNTIETVFLAGKAIPRERLAVPRN